jgi:hypothetical protein
MRVWGMALALVLAACGGAAEPEAPIREGATFTEVRTQVFRSCAGLGCHSEAAEISGNLVVRPDDPFADQVYANLVNAPVAEVPGRPAPPVQFRVVPGDPEASFLYWKLLGHEPGNPDNPVVGNRMPPTLPPPGLPAEQVELVRNWIAAGALND